MAQKKRDEKEIEEVRKLLPKAPPPKVLEEMKRRQKAQRLVYRCGYYWEPITGLKQKAALVHCTGCGESYYLDYSVGGGGCHAGGYGDSFGFRDPLDNESKITGNTCICPECGAEAEALHISHIKGVFDIERNYFTTVYNLRGHFVALSWLLTKQVDKEGRVSWDVKKYEGIAMIGGLPIRYTGYVSGIYGTWFPEWKERMVWRDNTDEWDEEEIFMDRADFDASDASKSGLERYIADTQKKIRLAAYLKLWSKDPQIENLVRAGASLILKEIIERSTVTVGYNRRDFSTVTAEQFFDRKKVKPHEMLGVEKEELPAVVGWRLDRLRFFREVKSQKKIRLSVAQLEEAEKVGLDDIRYLMKGAKNDIGFDPPLIRMINYLVRKKKELKWSNGLGVCLLDYWRMTKEIQGDLPAELIYPKDLRRAHDQAVLRKKEKTDREINEAIKKYAKTLSALAFKDEETGLLIRPAADQEELIKEGKFLSHCVATYAKSVSRRETSILFIRKIEEPEIPFFTLEFKDGKVIQNRGKNNCKRTENVKKFERKWLEYLKEGKNRNGRNAQRNSRKAG